MQEFPYKPTLLGSVTLTAGTSYTAQGTGIFLPDPATLSATDLIAIELETVSVTLLGAAFWQSVATGDDAPAAADDLDSGSYGKLRDWVFYRTELPYNTNANAFSQRTARYGFSIAAGHQLLLVRDANLASATDKLVVHQLS